MRVRVHAAHYGAGYVASSADEPGQSVHGPGFDEALVELASKHPHLCPPDGSPPRLGDLSVELLDERYGQYLLDVTRR